MADTDTPTSAIELRPDTTTPERVVLDGEIVDDTPDWTQDLADQPLTRPPWLGIGHTARRVWARILRRAGRRLVRRIASTRHIPGILLHWFWIGFRKWPAFAHWMLAVPEHQSIGVERHVKRGKATVVTTRTRKQAWAMTALQTTLCLFLSAGWFLVYRYHQDVPDSHRWLQWLAWAPQILATIVYGATHDTKPVATNVTVRARGEADPTAMTLILRDVGLLRKPDKNGEGGENVTYNSVPTPEGSGWVHSYELPKTCGKHAGHVKAKKDEIAAALGVDPDWVDITGKGHRFQIWIAEEDPFADPTDSPLMDVEEWCVFDGAPVGLTVRGRSVVMPIVGTHSLSAGLPNVGKSGFARSKAAAAILDPHCDIHVFDFKGGKDWQPLQRIATTFHNGPVPEQIRALKAWIKQSEAETAARAALLRSLPDDECPDGKITRRLHQTDRMRFQFLIVDEAHLAFEDPDLLDALIRYVKERRFVGFGLDLITQTVEGKLAERFTGLRSVIGTRIALRLMDWVASNQILGDQMNTKGWNAGDLPPVMGLAIVRADMDADGQADKGAGKVRAHYIDIPDLTRLCKHGEYLRGLADPDGNPLPQVETSDEELSAEQLLDRFRGADIELEGVTDAKTLGEFLARAGSKAHRLPTGARVRSRAAVEAALGLSEGRLAADEGSSNTTPDRELPSTVVNPPDNPTDKDPS